MTWKYINPGDYRLLHNWNSSYCVNHRSKAIAPVTGIAFGSTYDITYPVKIPAGTKEIWAAFTWFSTSASTSTSDMPRIIFFGASTLSYYSDFSYQLSPVQEWLYINDVNKLNRSLSDVYLARIWLHVKSGTSDGAAEIYRNGQLIYSVSNTNIMKGEDILLRQLNTRYTNYLMSDIIISDEPIDLNEHVAVLPISETNADGWTYDAVNNRYVADSADKTIWQVPDINQLKTVTGLDNPSITSVAIQAYNISTNDTLQVDTLQKSVKQNGQTVITDSADISNSKTAISPAMTSNPVTNAAWTLNDLNNVQLGITVLKST